MSLRPRHFILLLVFVTLSIALKLVMARRIHRRELNRELIAAVQRQDYPKVKYLVHQGAEMSPEKDIINLQIDCSGQPIGCGYSPLEMAIIRCDDETVHFLVDKTPIEHPTGLQVPSYGPLLTAAQFGDVEAVRLFMARGENVNESESHGFTVLDMALKYQDEYHDKAARRCAAQIIKMLDAVKADSIVRDNIENGLKWSARKRNKQY